MMKIQKKATVGSLRKTVLKGKEIWNIAATVVRDVATNMLGMTSEPRKEKQETKRCKKVQESVQ